MPSFQPNLTRVLLLVISSIAILSACSTTHRPCEAGGDVAWQPPIMGHMRCEQKRLRSGQEVNDGSFKQWYKTGKLALEGRFENGQRSGVWSYYDEAGVKRVEQRFENGVAVAAPATLSK